MDMERRSAMDRTRELPNLKKPRVSEGPLTNSRVSNSNAPLNPRFRTNEREREKEREREREDTSSYRQQSELIGQYKSALSELTFNSKPIITNLTIIAGENLHAAKGIAATICSNVLEVPSDQKLPSLYLLDSIVKNIGKDYIKHFAAKLPEVFCRAYKQVEPPIHNSMRHLFGTWKTVFPPTTLQIIEKELGFSSAANGSSITSTVSRVDPQRPPQSIHVNPKYLEARQRLQQTSSREIDSDEEDDVIPNGDVSRLAVTGNARQWPDPSSKMQNVQRPQREPIKEPKYVKKGPVTSRLQDPRIKERPELEKSYYGRGSEGAVNIKNSYDANHSYGKHRPIGFDQSDRQAPSVSTANRNVPTPNWKNSDEEEYMWDDLNGYISSIKGTGSQRGQSIPNEKEQPDLHHKAAGFPRSRSSTAEDSAPVFEDVDNQHLELHAQLKADSRTVDTSSDSLSTWPPREPGYLSVWPPPESKPSVANQTLTSSRYPGKPFNSNSSTSLPPPLPKSDYTLPLSLGLKSTKLPNPSEIIGQPRRQPTPAPQNLELRDVAHDNKHPPYSQMPPKTMEFPSHLKKSPPNPIPVISSSSIKEEKLPNDAPAETSASDLLAAIMKSGLLPGVSSTSNLNNVQPPLPNGPPPSQPIISSPSPTVTPSSLPGSSILPPLPPGPPPSHKSNSSSDPNPFSSLLSSLVAKGIIASSPATTETPATAPVTVPNEKEELILPEPKKEDPDSMELDELIGVDFKPEIIKEFNPLVISSLFDDLKHQCDVCGLRARTQEQLRAHLDLHSLEKKDDELSRRWYSDKHSWVFGDTDFLDTSFEEVNDKPDSMVPADENQCVCALCGEPFEDFYCDQRDEWMYKGTVYLDSSLVVAGFESMNQYLIVHAKCNKDCVFKNNSILQ